VIKAFRDGEMISELIGLQPEARILEFIRSIAPSQSDLLVEKGFSLLAMQEAIDAQETFLEALEDDDEDTKALLGLAMSLLLQGKGAESFQILEDFPTSREFKKAEVLFPLSEALLAFEIKDIAESDYPLDAAFHNAIRLVKRDNMEAAMDGLLYILREDKHYADERARKVIVAILELLGDQDPIAREYRKELASVLF